MMMGARDPEEPSEIEKMAQEEKILVLVRMRPLNEKEIRANEVTDWECIDDKTVLYRNTLREGSTLASAYTFDRVFQGEFSTKHIYEEGPKQIALSVVKGINSCIFAYGQTSSGKTYTMSGITEYAVADIFDYMCRHQERDFVLKFSAIEIYNEAIRDLLSLDNTPLRLLDDPERGPVIENVTEETIRGWNHFKELVSVCEAQRQVGETPLNERSSRSHQIIRLMVESSGREFFGKENSTTLAATVNFIDLAGSERASQALSAGARLKEGCHINRSLLTLGTVIRKLSKGGHGHINYRDSKLTRILQPCLGGNARTAIVCTLSPARSHVEQTRNTLLFACCAKEVVTKAQVNVVMSDKALVKHLQRELARLEHELRSPAPAALGCDHTELLKKKDLQIEQMEKELQDLTRQRDLAQSRLEGFLRMSGTPPFSESKDDPWDNSFEVASSSCRDDVVMGLNTPLHGGEEKSFPGRPGNSRSRFAQLSYDSNSKLLSTNDSVSSRASKSTEADSIRSWAAEGIRSIRSFGVGLREMIKNHNKVPKVDTENSEKDLKAVGLAEPRGTFINCSEEFERQRQEILELWKFCNVSLIYRTFFFLLFKGEPWDSNYAAVELRRLSYLKQSFLQGKSVAGHRTITLVSSLMELHEEKRMLSKLLGRKLSEKERKCLYRKFGVAVNSKQRRLQLANVLWSYPKNTNHVVESAAVVARIVGFEEKENAFKEMFGLSFTPPRPRPAGRNTFPSLRRSKVQNDVSEK